VGLVYDPRGLPGITTARPEVAGVLQMVSELTLAVLRARTGEKDTVVYGSGTWVRTYDALVLWEGHSMIRILLTGRTDVVKRECSWLQVNRRGRRSSKGGGL
jgi:hypothetical protein